MPSVESLTPTDVTYVDQYPGLNELFELSSDELTKDPAGVREVLGKSTLDINYQAAGNAGTQRGDEGKGDEVNSQAQTAIDSKAVTVEDPGLVLKVTGGGRTGHTSNPLGGPKEGIVYSVLPAAFGREWRPVVGRGVLGRPDKLINEIE